MRPLRPCPQRTHRLPTGAGRDPPRIARVALFDIKRAKCRQVVMQGLPCLPDAFDANADGTQIVAALVVVTVEIVVPEELQAIDPIKHPLEEEVLPARMLVRVVVSAFDCGIERGVEGFGQIGIGMNTAVEVDAVDEVEQDGISRLVVDGHFAVELPDPGTGFYVPPAGRPGAGRAFCVRSCIPRCVSSVVGATHALQLGCHRLERAPQRRLRGAFFDYDNRRASIGDDRGSA